MNIKTDFKNDLNKATIVGASAFNKGIERASACDIEFSYYIKKYSTADWSRTKELLLLMKAWQKGWDSANLSSK